ncbi:MAG: nucleoside deaminase [Candidatus Gottesmanbacteria bacterium]|nr:nucleoside deaminase [Candidatus Gottesmanbacteria bacterium]
MTTDEYMIRRCIKLAENAVAKGDSPFGALVACGRTIIAESENRMRLDHDITQHAEILAIRKAQKKLHTSDLTGYTLYSNCEPCPMCSFMAREAKFKKIVFALPSRWMGGYTRWHILQDKKLSQFRPFFRSPPVIVRGLLEDEAKKIFQRLEWDWMF